MPLPEPAFNIRRTKRDGPEAEIVERIKNKLTLLNWFVVVLHGNLYQFGMPDLFCTHKNYGIRLVEVKNPKNYGFTAAQLEVFPKLMAHGANVYVLVDDSDAEINKLMGPGNWWTYLPIVNNGRPLK